MASREDRQRAIRKAGEAVRGGSPWLRRKGHVEPSEEAVERATAMLYGTHRGFPDSGDMHGVRKALRAAYTIDHPQDREAGRD